MASPISITDRAALDLHRTRAQKAPVHFLHDHIADEIKERLEEVNKTFTKVAIICCFPDYWASHFPCADILSDADVLDFPQSGYDLVLHTMCLHWADDPVGQLVQSQRVMAPDGLFLATLFGGETLSELREVLGTVEVAITGGLSPRVLPMGEVRDLGALLQRAGFALPVADTAPYRVTYPSVRKLAADLRGMGEANALAARHKAILPSAFWQQVDELYRHQHSDENDQLIATFAITTLTGWAPDPSQQKPLRPGSAQQRLADALSTDELPLNPTSD